MPKIDCGDTVKVSVKIREGGKERTQGYEGVVIKRNGAGVSQTITVRRVFQGIGIERVFLIHSPRVEKIAVLRRGHVRRSKLYYLRALTGKATRIKERGGLDKDQVQATPEKAASLTPGAKPDASKTPAAPAALTTPDTTAAAAAPSEEK